jgi:hypothetical protein
MKQVTTLMCIVVGVCVLLSATLLTIEATPVPICTRDNHKGILRPRDTEEERYKKLRAAILDWNNREILIQNLQINSHCPFQVLKFRNITRIMCDRLKIKNCNSDVAYCKDISDNCHQAYMFLRDISPSVRRRNTEKVEVGCIYHPRAIGMSMKSPETTDASRPYVE